jgi:glycosyltransferase involved in cell wall biosynthesis
MKILLVSEDIPGLKLGGLAKHVVTLGNALLQAGHQVSILGKTNPDYDACRAEVGFEGEFIGGLSSTIGGWKEGRLGLFNPAKRPYFARRMAREILRYADGYDVIHYHGHLPLVAHFIPDAVNFVQTRHDQGSDCLTHIRFKREAVCSDLAPRACAGCIVKEPSIAQEAISAGAVAVYRALVRSAFSRHKSIFVSRCILENAKRTLGAYPLRNAKVIHNFIDTDRVRNLSGISGPLSARPKSVMIASRLDDAKGVGAFLQLWVKDQRSQGIPVEIFGDGPRGADWVKAYASDNIMFHGHAPYERTIQRVSSSRIAVVPSVWEEPCATTVLESLFLGQSCFALRRGGTPELSSYEQWPGQLCLANDMAELVNDLLDALVGFRQAEMGQADVAWPSSFEGDVHRRIPEILSVYQSRQ